MTSEISKSVEKQGGIQLYAYNLMCWLLRTSTLHYGLLSFETKTLWNSINAYSSVYFIGHLMLLIIFIAYPMMKPKYKVK